MLGKIILAIILILILTIMIMSYRSLSACHEGEGGVLCKIFHFAV